MDLTNMPSWKVRMRLVGELKEYTVTEAIKELSKGGYAVYIDSMLLYNDIFLDAMRQNGVSEVVKRLKELPEANDWMKALLDDFMKKHPDGSIGCPDIKEYQTWEQFTLLGHKFDGISDLMAYVEADMYDDSSPMGQALY